jgi:hypothetical protein
MVRTTSATSAPRMIHEFSISVVEMATTIRVESGSWWPCPTSL